MIDLHQLKATIEAAPEGGRAAIVRRGWLEQVYQELAAGRAAQAQLAAIQEHRP